MPPTLDLERSLGVTGLAWLLGAEWEAGGWRLLRLVVTYGGAPASAGPDAAAAASWTIR